MTQKKTGVSTLVVGMMAVFMVAVDFSAANLALASIQSDMHAKLSHLQWIINAYFLVFACFMVTAGHMGDKFGHKKLMMLGAGIFGVASLAGGFSPAVEWIIVSRVFQGIGGSLMWPSVIALSMTSLGESKKGTALGAILGIAGFSMAFGPIMGGVFTEYLSWRWIFFINFPIGLLVVLFAGWLIPASEGQKEESIDYKGNALLIIALFGILYALQDANQWGWGSLRFILILAASLVFLGIFLLVELKIHKPLFDTHWLGKRGISGVIIARMLLLYAWCAILFIMALYFQNIRGLSPLSSGVWFIPLTIGIGIISPFGGRIVDKIGVKYPTFLGFILSIVGYGWLLGIHPEVPMLFFVGPFICLGFGMGFASASLGTALVDAMPKEQVGSASGVYYMVTLLGGSIGLAVSGYFLGEGGSERLVNILSERKIELSVTQQTSLEGILGAPHRLADVAVSWGEGMHQKVMSAVHVAYVEMLFEMILIFLILTTVGFFACVWAFWGQKISSTTDEVDVSIG